jgi:hypothetical protein
MSYTKKRGRCRYCGRTYSLNKGGTLRFHIIIFSGAACGGSGTEAAASMSAARDKFIGNMAQLLAGLQVPVSMEIPLGAAGPAWTELHRSLHGFGWATAADYETAIRTVLEEK